MARSSPVAAVLVAVATVVVVAGVLAVGRSGSTGLPGVADCRAEIEAGSDVESDPLRALIEAGEAARERDRRCGPPVAERRLCRALWLIQHLDPIVISVVTDDPGLRARARALVAWSLSDGSDVASPPLRAALDVLARPIEGTDDLIERSRPWVIGPIRDADQRC